MMHDPWKSIFLHAVIEFAEQYPRLVEQDAGDARSQLEEVAEFFLSDQPHLTIRDLQSQQYNADALFYVHLLQRLEQVDEMRLEAIVARCGWIRRHGNPRSAIAELRSIAQAHDVPPSLRSTAAYEIAQAHAKLKQTTQAITWLRVSAIASEESGNLLQSLMSQAAAASWEVETAPEKADATLRMLRNEFRNIVKDDGPNRDTAARWVMNTTYQIAKVAVKTGQRGVLETCLDDLEKPEYRECQWITNDQLNALRAAL